MELNRPELPATSTSSSNYYGERSCRSGAAARGNFFFQSWRAPDIGTIATALETETSHQAEDL